MRTLKLFIGSLLFIFLLVACSHTKRAYIYKPDDQKLYDTIVHLDSVFFRAYNNCTVDLDKYAAFYTDDVEFYHDKGGLTTNKKDIVDGTKKNICGKVTRTVLKSSIEVYPIKDYGAIEMGLHQFFNNQEPDVKPHYSKFTIFWRNTANGWKIAKVISLH